MSCSEFARQRLAVMSNGSRRCDPLCRCGWSLLLVTLTVALLSSKDMFSQSASTGALTGVTLDPSGAVLPRAGVHLTSLDGTVAMAASSDEKGLFGFFLLPPGTYELQASKLDFRPVTQKNIQVHVTETLRIELHLELAIRVESAQITSDPSMVQLDTSALGRIV